VSDQLSAAARALRLSRSGASASAHATEERIVARIASRSRRTRRVHWLLPIAAVMAVSSGWAATQRDVQRGARAWWLRLTAPAAAPSLTKRSARPGASASSTAGAATLAASAPPLPPPLGAHVVAGPPIVAATPSSKRPLSTADASEPFRQPSVTPAPEQPSSLQLYQRAHELHFRKHDFAAALATWDVYLASTVNGPLALEARYNRAICLTRLGRNAEARTALLPFARGDYGGYRQAEASALLNGGETLEP
jgi:hypothetical protein